MPVYTVAAPAWRPPLHTEGGLGYPGLHPPPRTVLTPEMLRHGYTAPRIVANETASVHEQIHERLARPTTLPQLGALLDAVFRERRQPHEGTIDPPAFQMPPRATLQQDKLALYVRALADVHVPLAQLQRGVPYGFLGEQLLEMLWYGNRSAPTRGDATGHSVAISRALWFLQVTGAEGIHAEDGVACTDEWTPTVLQWLTAQLHALPADPKQAKGWADKWSYSVALTQAMVARAMIDEYTYLAWLGIHLASMRGGARGCLLQLTEGKLPEMTKRGAVQGLLRRALQVPDEAYPWVARQAALLLDQVGEPPAGTSLVDAGLAPLLTSPAAKGSALDAVHALDTETDMASLFLRFFSQDTHADPVERVRLLLTWACTTERTEAGRAFLAASLLSQLVSCQEARLVLRDGRRVVWHGPPVALFATLVDWLADKEKSREAMPVMACARLLGVLARRSLFPYARFLQYVEPRGTNEQRSGWLTRVFRAMPVDDMSETLRSQRTSLCAATQADEDATERQALREVLCAHPFMDAGNESSTLVEERPSTSLLDAFAVEERMPHLFRASAYVQERVVAQLLPRVLNEAHRPLQADEFAQIAVLLTALEAFPALVQVCIAQLDRPVAPSCVVSMCHTIAAHARVFGVLDTASALVERVAPYAVGGASASVATARIVPAQGRTMAVAAARRALSALGQDKSAPLPEASWPSEDVQQRAAESCASVLYGSVDQLDAASEALLVAVPLAEAPGALWAYALDAFSQPDARPPTPAVIGCMAALAGAAGVCLPLGPWASGLGALYSGTRRVSSAWCALVFGMVRYGHVDVDEVTAMLRTYASAEGALWVPCQALSDALVCTSSDPASPCGWTVMGTATWYDVSLLRTMRATHTGLLPWIMAAWTTRHGTSLIPHIGLVQKQWWAHPDTCAQALESSAQGDVVRMLHALHANLLPATLSVPAEVGRAVIEAGPWAGTWALVELQCLVHAASEPTLRALAEVLLTYLLPGPAASAGAPLERLVALGVAPSFLDALAAVAWTRWEQGEAGAEHALARLAALNHTFHLPSSADALATVLTRIEETNQAAAASATRTAPRHASAGGAPSATAPRLASPLDRSDTPCTPDARGSAAVLSPLVALVFLLRTAEYTPQGAWTPLLCSSAPLPRASLAAFLTPLLAWAEAARVAETYTGAVPLAAVLAACHVEVQRSTCLRSLQAWLRAAPPVSPALAHLVHNRTTTLPLDDAWKRFDAVEAYPLPASRDPWAVSLANTATIPLESVHTRKTRDSVPHSAARAAPPTWLPSEQTYGDLEAVTYGTAAPRRTKRAASPLAHRDKRHRGHASDQNWGE